MGPNLASGILSMSTLTILAPPVTPPASAAPGKLVDAPTAARPGDVPRAAVIVQLSEQVRELTKTEKQDADERNEELPNEALSQDQAQQVRDLKKADREVRSHETARKAAAGAYARSAAQFETVVGPDGRRYAVGGEVAIDTSAIGGNPEATARKMEQVARAALAPSDPSTQDRAVAVQARQTASEARRDIILERADERSAQTEEAQTEAAGENRLDAPGNANERSGVGTAASDRHQDRPSLRLANAPDTRETDRAADARTEATVHGHSAQDSCPLCQAQGAPSVRPHGGLDLSA